MELTPDIMNKLIQIAVLNPFWNKILKWEKETLFKQKETLFSNEFFQKLR